MWGGVEAPFEQQQVLASQVNDSRGFAHQRWRHVWRGFGFEFSCILCKMLERRRLPSERRPFFSFQPALPDTRLRSPFTPFKPTCRRSPNEIHFRARADPESTQVKRIHGHPAFRSSLVAAAKEPTLGQVSECSLRSGLTNAEQQTPACHQIAEQVSFCRVGMPFATPSRWYSQSWSLWRYLKSHHGQSHALRKMRRGILDAGRSHGSTPTGTCRCHGVRSCHYTGAPG